MSIRLADEHLTLIRESAERAYPYECCGILLGTWQSNHKIVHAIWPVENTWEEDGNPLSDGESSQRRFLIDPLDFKRAHDHAHTQGWGVVGTYHSHPNHPASPSDFDRQYAFPWGFSCLIVSVRDGVAADLYSWILDEQEQPQREDLDVLQHL